MGSITGRVLSFSRKRYGPRREREAWVDFFGSVPPPYSESSLFKDVFIPWYLYSWSPKPVAMMYSERNRTSQEAIARALVEAASAARYSFHLVQEVRPGQAVLLKDEARGTLAWVLGQPGPRRLVPGEIIFSKVIEVFGLRFMFESGSTVIPENYLEEIRGEGRSPDSEDPELQRIRLYYKILGQILTQKEALPFK